MPLTPTEALSVLVEASLYKTQYEIIRETFINRYLCNSILQREKKLLMSSHFCKKYRSCKH